MKPRFIPYNLAVMSHVAKWQQPCRPGVKREFLNEKNNLSMLYSFSLFSIVLHSNF